MAKGSRETDLSSRAGRVFAQLEKTDCSKQERVPFTRYAWSEVQSHLAKLSLKASHR